VELSLTLALARLFRSMIELNESTRFCAFVNFSGHVDMMKIDIGEGKERPHYSNNIYSREFRCKKESFADAASVAEIQQVINLVNYLIVMDQDMNVYDPTSDDCVWDADRIEATKKILFYEHISRGGSLVVPFANRSNVNS
jgi:hypothetical protein